METTHVNSRDGPERRARFGCERKRLVSAPSVRGIYDPRQDITAGLTPGPPAPYGERKSQGERLLRLLNMRRKPIQF